ncbi:hypothetical protein Mal15_21400 [Stieleria maiorica]|uniref:Uncharacterized protein n=1 Tax=Stieleria maiorica TaxID=2795974 RepID=A0A5B9MBH9_9BACT|nr:hypothetical protein Mal15_21400 [Stieleria maiorica]
MVASSTDNVLAVVLDDTFLESVPIASTAYKSLKAIRAGRDALLEHKLERFLHGLSDIPEDAINEHIEQLEADGRYASDVGTSLLLLIDQLDDVGKAEMLAKVWAAYLRDEINATELFNLCEAIKTIRWLHIDAIRDLLGNETETRLLTRVASEWREPNTEIRFIWKEQEKFCSNLDDYEILMQLSNAGLLTRVVRGGGGMGQRGGLVINQTARLFYRILLADA